ncbi:hypothetical protein H5200_18220 [Pseudoalteromonas sp. SG43-7]|uniref:hypothetical protein n=1 Tax=unclassified Pseudoalteromonas TaxID=194690 RepID=UPI001601A0C1|nr:MULTISPECIES: hypothetical protein [unclassified Pseudoalteromonas]MBB1335854.1 hypothetical protein [Pseudoalteromonas sp. SR41-6]MBB1343595.1 hypothetical protein [Pseudoalteromonas sp. SR45-6]MBB1423840.1 hypothetical protein [Pseudoalteromonas sp. SG43-7]MBB1470806.1 hypothetical protein [Pseudoalteromonas sp. SG41-5]
MKLLLFIVLCSLLCACTASTGDISIYSVGSDKNLTSPLVTAKELYSADGMIYKTDEAHALSGDDTFSIYLTDTYLRYLPDIGGDNEVLIVAEFEEVVTGTSSDTITKILGPYDSIADATKAPFFHKALYGPKRMESDLLSLKLKIYEYDLDENDKAGSIIDFIAAAGEALSLSNPVTTEEIKVAKEIAKSVTGTNDNDLVFQLDLDFVAGNSLYRHSGNNNVNVLPLKAGEIVLIKKEVCAIGRCYDYFSKEEGIRNPVGYATDILLSPITAMTIGLTDTPAGSSLSDVEPQTLEVRSEGLVHKSKSDEKSDGSTEKVNYFTDKTWLRLSILKGGDPELWEKRKLLYPIEAEINGLLKSSTGIKSDNLTAPIASLNKAQKQLAAMKQNGIKLVSNNSSNNTQYILKGSTSGAICLDIPTRFKLTQALPLFDGSPQQKLPSYNKYRCYKLMPSVKAQPFKKGTLYFQINYTDNDVLKSHIATVEVVDEFPE